MKNLIKYLKETWNQFNVLLKLRKAVKNEFERLVEVQKKVEYKYDVMISEYGVIKMIAKNPEKRMELLNAIMPVMFLLPEQKEYEDFTQEQLDSFKIQANTIKNTPAFQWLMRDMQNEAQKILFEKAVGETDLIAGKTMLYTLDVLRQKIDNLSK